MVNRLVMCHVNVRIIKKILHVVCLFDQQSNNQKIFNFTNLKNRGRQQILTFDKVGASHCLAFLLDKLLEQSSKWLLIHFLTPN